jgi:hypothetical protein
MSAPKPDLATIIIPFHTDKPANFPSHLNYLDQILRSPSLSGKGKPNPGYIYAHIERQKVTGPDEITYEIKDLHNIPRRCGLNHPALHSAKSELRDIQYDSENETETACNNESCSCREEKQQDKLVSIDFPSSIYGLFARVDIPAYQPLFIYGGVENDIEERGSPGVNYFHLTDQVEICAEKYCNHTRMINDFRGLMREPNLHFYVVRDIVSSDSEHNQALDYVVFESVRDVYAGEELCVDYSEEYWGGQVKALQMTVNKPFYELETD